jgi:hypothetical protein
MNKGEKFKIGFKTGACMGMDPKIRLGKAMKSVVKSTKRQQTSAPVKHVVKGIIGFVGKFMKNK